MCRDDKIRKKHVSVCISVNYSIGVNLTHRIAHWSKGVRPRIATAPKMAQDMRSTDAVGGIFSNASTATGHACAITDSRPSRKTITGTEPLVQSFSTGYNCSYGAGTGCSYHSK